MALKTKELPAEYLRCPTRVLDTSGLMSEASAKSSVASKTLEKTAESSRSLESVTWPRRPCGSQRCQMWPLGRCRA